MNYVHLISGGPVCKDGLLLPRFAPPFEEKCKQSNQSCDHGEWQRNPIVHQTMTKTPLPFAPLCFFLLHSLCLQCFWHLLPPARPAAHRSNRQIRRGLDVDEEALDAWTVLKYFPARYMFVASVAVTSQLHVNGQVDNKTAVSRAHVLKR
jgi:hypothetical protein